MGMNASKLDRRIKIMRPTFTDDGFGGRVPTYHLHGTIWAHRSDVKDSEKFQSGRMSSEIVARFTVRSSAFSRDINPVDRIHHAGLDWNITGTKESADGRLNFIELTATAENNG